jgi:aminodeoxyfutalosine synthase
MNFIFSSNISDQLKAIAEKVALGKRISEVEGLFLYEKADLGYLAVLANHVRERLHGKKTFFNRNFHIEPTNICIYNCKFCSYVRKIGQEGAWEYNLDQIEDLVHKHKSAQPTEVHIVGGVHPKRDLHYYGEMIQRIKAILPEIHVKGFTAVELEFMIKKARLSLREGLLKLKEYGLDSIPGGGAEIFAPEIRVQVCDEKSTAEKWLEIHETAHLVGLPSNATILYGHIENYAHRIDHIARLRQLQDKTGGFNTFIPLKYRNQNNSLSEIGEVSLLEDLRNFAVSRIFLDNIPHLKAYWPMLGKEKAQLSLSFGVDDIDGTIDDSTKIYSMAGVEDLKPQMTTNQLVELIKSAGFEAVERDTLYNVIKIY